MNVIEAQGLIKRFGHRLVLNGLNFQARAGEQVAVIGANGAGKTTLLRILALLTRPDSGKVCIAGCPPSNQTTARASLGVLLHQSLLYGDLTVEENLRFYGRLYNISTLETRLTETLDRIGLSQRRKDPAHTLSRGMQQRLAIGRAILHDPEILLFDEPYTGLDPEAATMLDNLLREWGKRGRTVILTAHEPSRLAGLVTRVDILAKGVILSSLTPEDLNHESLFLLLSSPP